MTRVTEGGRPGKEAPGCMGGPTGSPSAVRCGHWALQFFTWWLLSLKGLGGAGGRRGQSSPQVLPDQTGRDMVSDWSSTRAG